MIDRWEAWLHRWRYRLSRNAWLVWLLGTPVGQDIDGGGTARRGLLLIQIDGLARRHFEAALDKGRMPFCQSLIRRDHYRLRTMYSGLPSTTPSVQGELFYGVRQVVPAFAFRDAQSGEQVRMFSAPVASRIQAELEAQSDQPLLQGGSAYCNIYTGGAAEPHFCAAALGWGTLTEGVRPWTWLLISLLYAPEILRACLLLLLEFVVSFYDAVRGFISRRHLLQEVEFILRRVLVSVVLRELATIAASIDAARGLPVVEVNFLGYDEQSHHRGPDARYAQWSLGGIDNAIRRIWRAGAHSPHREFDLWVYSDHGQEKVTNYLDTYGREVQEAVAEIVDRHARVKSVASQHRTSAKNLRSSYLRRERLQQEIAIAPRSDRVSQPDGRSRGSDDVEVVAMGPLGHIYYQQQLMHEQWEAIAKSLVVEAHVPLVLLAETGGRAQAWAPGRHGFLPDDGALFLGEEHPFLEAATDDLVRLVQHRDAGNLVFGGWAAGERPMTYVLERGAHGGCGPDEVSAFVLVPPDAQIQLSEGQIARPRKLRESILCRDQIPFMCHTSATQAGQRSLRVMTYNIRSCMGTDGRTSPERVARVIAASQADVVALQEVDVGRQRTGYLDQAHRLAELLDMHTHFHRTFEVAQEQYGHAVLSRWPLRVVRSEPLPTLLPKALEPRGALWVELNVDGRAVQCINTHLGLVAAERLQQIDHLLGPDWLANPQCQPPLILCGDLNAGPSSPVYRRLAASLVDVQRARKDRRQEKTFLSGLPLRRIDHIFVGGAWGVEEVRVIRSSLARRASDHLPLMAELRLND
jgi:endonuclease/exonuclease/phosphatase family metal-dependent hydrolase